MRGSSRRSIRVANRPLLQVRAALAPLTRGLKFPTRVRAYYRLFAAMSRIVKLVGLENVLASGEAVWPRPVFRKGLPSRYESAFEIRQFASLLHGAFG